MTITLSTPSSSSRAAVERRQQPQPFGLSQRDARVRLEGQHNAFAAVGAGPGDQPPDQGVRPRCTPSYDPTVTAGRTKCGSASKP